MKEYCTEVIIGVVVCAESKEEAEEILIEQYNEGLGCDVRFLNDGKEQ